jgi:hypothetical protein
LLVECDLTYSDLTQALGTRPTPTPRPWPTSAPSGHDLGVEHLEGIRLRHDGGFDVLLGPTEVGTVIADDALRTVVGLAAASADVVVLHLPRELSSVARWCLEQADRVVEVLTLDVLSFRSVDARARGARSARRPTAGGVRRESEPAGARSRPETCDGSSTMIRSR